MHVLVPFISQDRSLLRILLLHRMQNILTSILAFFRLSNHNPWGFSIMKNIGLHSDTAESLSLGRAADTLDFWKIRPARFRPEAGLAGSPERCLFRTVVEDETGRSFILESLDPRTTERRREIARALDVLGRRLPEVRSYLPPRGRLFILAEGRRFWQVSPFVEGLPLQRPEYAGEGWRGPVLADFLIRLKQVSAELPDTSPAGNVFPGRIRSLARTQDPRPGCRPSWTHIAGLPIFGRGVF